jgi:osmoprotectant transport system substrate-binding protein
MAIRSNCARLGLDGAPGEGERLGRRSCAGFCIVGILIALAGCDSPSRTAAVSALRDNAVTVGAFDFSESEVIAEIYSQALEGGGYRVNRAFNLGPRELVWPALARGLIELVPEYAGTALDFESLGMQSSTADVRRTHARLDATLAASHVAALRPAPAQDANTFVVTRATAARDNLRTLSDLAPVASHMALGGPPECPSRPNCQLGLERVYGLHFKQFVRLDTGGPVTRKALQEGYVDVALLFTTDPAIEREGLVELVDDRDLQPSENVVPLLRREVVDHFGSKVVALVDAASARLTTAALTDLNAQVERGRSPAEVASEWLQKEGLR